MRLGIQLRTQTGQTTCCLHSAGKKSFDENRAVGPQPWNPAVLAGSYEGLWIFSSWARHKTPGDRPHPLPVGWTGPDPLGSALGRLSRNILFPKPQRPLWDGSLSAAQGCCEGFCQHPAQGCAVTARQKCIWVLWRWQLWGLCLGYHPSLSAQPLVSQHLHTPSVLTDLVNWVAENSIAPFNNWLSGKLVKHFWATWCDWTNWSK